MTILSEHRDAWQRIANAASEQRPCEGRRVRIVEGRKHKGRSGVVVRHQLSKFGDAFRYGGAANLHMREMQGRSGFVCLVEPDDGGSKFWVNADYTEVLDN